MDLPPDRIDARHVEAVGAAQKISERGGVEAVKILVVHVPFEREPVAAAPAGDDAVVTFGRQGRVGFEVAPPGSFCFGGNLGQLEQQRINLLHVGTVTVPVVFRQAGRPRDCIAAELSEKAWFVGENAADGSAELIAELPAVAFVDQREEQLCRPGIHEVGVAAIDPRVARCDAAVGAALQNVNAEFRAPLHEFAVRRAGGPAAFVVDHEAEPEAAALVDGRSGQAKELPAEIAHFHAAFEVAFTEIVRHRVQVDRAEAGRPDLRQLSSDAVRGRVGVPVPENSGHGVHGMILLRFPDKIAGAAGKIQRRFPVKQEKCAAGNRRGRPVRNRTGISGGLRRLCGSSP